MLLSDLASQVATDYQRPLVKNTYIKMENGVPSVCLITAMAEVASGGFSAQQIEFMYASHQYNREYARKVLEAAHIKTQEHYEDASYYHDLTLKCLLPVSASFTNKCFYATSDALEAIIHWFDVHELDAATIAQLLKERGF